MTMALDRQALGIYLHLPFCAQVCHYCDFAKTALYDAGQRERYMRTLADHLQAWMSALSLSTEQSPYQVVSVFLGGGTPSLLTKEWEPIMALLQPLLGAGVEVSLEANPEHITDEALSIWRGLGINRLSLGVQTLQPEGLRFLTRQHTGNAAVAAMVRALRVLPNVNVDYIYSWPGASEAQWRDDLRRAIDAGVPHLSLYNLTYAANTVIGRRERRGLLSVPSDEEQAHFYQVACDVLAAAGYQQEEVSNWCQEGFSCRHNWLYWQNGYYLGLGTGAHGYLDDGTAIGVRYAYSRHWQSWESPTKPIAPGMEIANVLSACAVELDQGRDRESWLLELIGAGLRSNLGVCLAKAQNTAQRQFKPRPLVAEALAQGVLIKTADHRLLLRPDEWFRETAWATEVALSFVEAPVKVC